MFKQRIGYKGIVNCGLPLVGIVMGIVSKNSKNIGCRSKPSTAIRLFEKMVEPILLYNCEVSGAYLPKKWDLRKFQEKIWEVGKEINKVVLGFIRQLLGVNKKSTKIAVLAETGKYPLCIRIFDKIMKYWVRIRTSTNRLLSESYQSNKHGQISGKQSWMRVVDFLRKTTNVTQDPKMDPTFNNKLVNQFKSTIRHMYEAWWKKQAVPTGENKLDYYYGFKKCFKYETYLDNIPRHLRIHMTRFRISSHCLPIEVQRYNKKRKARVERKCDICNLDEMGDEEHYLLRCCNSEIAYGREQFIKNIKITNEQLVQFNNKNLFGYCMSMKDPAVQAPMSGFVKLILDTFREETQNSRQTNAVAPVKTKSGRLVKKPNKLNL